MSIKGWKCDDCDETFMYSDYELPSEALYEMAKHTSNNGHRVTTIHSE